MSKLCDTLSFCFLYPRLRKILFQMQEWTYMYCIQISGCNVADSIRYVADLFCVLRVFFSYVLCYNVPLLWEYCISGWLYHVMTILWFCRKKKKKKGGRLVIILNHVFLVRTLTPWKVIESPTTLIALQTRVHLGTPTLTRHSNTTLPLRSIPVTWTR